MRGRTLNSKCQEMVISLLEYFKAEKENGAPLLPLTAIRERVARALKINEITVTRIQQRFAQNPVFTSPGKKRPRKKIKTTDLDEPVKCEIRDTIYNMYKNKKHITLTNLNNELQDKSIVSFSVSSLQKLLPELGFKYKKDNNRRYLIEKLDIAVKRTAFLKKYKQNQNAPQPLDIIFLDETWIFSKGNPRKSWQDASTKSVKRPCGYEGKRFIVLHAGGENGFVNNASLIFASKSNSDDYHGEMNAENFVHWLETQFLPSLEMPSLIILDNAPYHSILSEKQPSSSFTKQKIVEWLEINNINFAQGLTKRELLCIARIHRKENIYVVDELIHRHGHEVLRTPPYQCEFNAIELVWADAKQYYDKHIGRDGNKDENVLAMWQEALDQVSPSKWKKCVDHTNKLIEKWYQIDIVEEVEPIIININNPDDSDTDTNDILDESD